MSRKVRSKKRFSSRSKPRKRVSKQRRRSNLIKNTRRRTRKKTTRMSGGEYSNDFFINDMTDETRFEKIRLILKNPEFTNHLEKISLTPELKTDMKSIISKLDMELNKIFDPTSIKKLYEHFLIVQDNNEKEIMNKIYNLFSKIQSGGANPRPFGIFDAAPDEDEDIARRRDIRKIIDTAIIGLILICFTQWIQLFGFRRFGFPSDLPSEEVSLWATLKSCVKPYIWNLIFGIFLRASARHRRRRPRERGPRQRRPRQGYPGPPYPRPPDPRPPDPRPPDPRPPDQD